MRRLIMQVISRKRTTPTPVEPMRMLVRTTLDSSLDSAENVVDEDSSCTPGLNGGAGGAIRTWIAARVMPPTDGGGVALTAIFNLSNATPDGGSLLSRGRVTRISNMTDAARMSRTKIRDSSIPIRNASWVFAATCQSCISSLPGAPIVSIEPSRTRVACSASEAPVGHGTCM